MPKKKHKDGENLPPDLNQVKKQIERERFLHIKKTFELRCKPSVAAHVSHHESLALTRTGAEDNNERNNNNFSYFQNKKKNNMLSFRMKIPLHYFDAFYVPDEENDEDPSQKYTLRRPILPFVEQLPRSITWVFTNRNQLTAKSGFVIGKKQINNVDGDVVQPNSENEEDEENQEETKKKKFEFSKDVDRFIWKIGQEYGLGDLVVQRALTKFLNIDVKELLGRYNELIKLKDEENAGEASDSSSKSKLPNFSDTIDRHFCRRCLIFGCKTHEKHQPVLKSCENNSNLFGGEDVREQCSELCYLKLRNDTDADTMVDNDNNSISNKKGKDVVSDTNTETQDQVTDTNEVIKAITELSIESQPYNEWTTMEKDLYLKGVEIFGRNSCLITRNLLNSIKTCLEVYNYMHEQDQDALLLEHNQTPEKENLVNKVVSRKSSKLVRKRLRKYALYPPALKQTAKGEIKLYQHYTPCTCKSICGDQCSCLANGNCCEKYCGCSKTCNNRFKGCNCAIGQCINRQCPCVATAHECDPDICQSCPVRCGHGSLGEISEQSHCKNMNFLHKKHKRIIIAKSDVQGWGAFSRYSLKRHDFLGEYTGELITHDEANERAKPNDHNFGSSYHFTLNQQLVIDAHRMGNKFRFLNHSSKPNCYAKLLVVRGEHRIGIYADRAIEEGEELFFDYCYGPGEADWCHSSKLRTFGSNKSKGIGPPSYKTCI